MSDFLKSLAARQLGEAAAVRPRLAGRFEPPTDAFAPEAPRRASEFEEPGADALELFLEVETHAAPARDSAPRYEGHEAPRAHEPRRESDETNTRVVFVKEPREESRPVLRQERSTTRDSERTHDSPAPPNAADSRARTRVRDADDAPVRPQHVVPASKDEGGPVRPATQAGDRSPFPARVRASGERDESSTVEPRGTSGREVDEVKRPSSDVRPAPPPSPARRQPAAAPSVREEELSFLRNESARARERERRGEDADESHAPRHVRRGRESSGAVEPRPVPRRERASAARDAQRERAEAPPTINVTIGRVEIRATQGPPPSPSRAESVAPRMSLDDYLRRRRNGEVRE